MFDQQELFNRFWQAYPRRVAKVAARRAWDKLGADGELLDLMLRALEWQRKGWNDIAYVPHPATWLNGRRWEDEQPLFKSPAMAPQAPSCCDNGLVGSGWHKRPCDCAKGNIFREAYNRAAGAQEG